MGAAGRQHPQHPAGKPCRRQSPSVRNSPRCPPPGHRPLAVPRARGDERQLPGVWCHPSMGRGTHAAGRGDSAAAPRVPRQVLGKPQMGQGFGGGGTGQDLPLAPINASLVGKPIWGGAATRTAYAASRNPGTRSAPLRGQILPHGELGDPTKSLGTPWGGSRGGSSPPPEARSLAAGGRAQVSHVIAALGRCQPGEITALLTAAWHRPAS